MRSKQPPNYRVDRGARSEVRKMPSMPLARPVMRLSNGYSWGKYMINELTSVWFRMLVLVLSFFSLLVYGFMAFLIYVFVGDEPPEMAHGYYFIAVIVPTYFLSFFLIEILADWHPKIRLLGLPILLSVILSLILTKESVRIWESLGKPMLLILTVLGLYSLHASYRTFKEGAESRLPKYSLKE